MITESTNWKKCDYCENKRDGKEQIITGTVKFRMKRKKALRLQMQPKIL
jgi:hypothetical protein